ncbi:3'(2'),5'-bisphosphate nucleotidase CysQ [Roseomonas populi]|uniref:3'(2'),5'-bisphosphate nucleotidase CysQ n=1 Tax=Roseomonas populi TaxID=3121582 RepID=A0ABT1X7H2_9PROT|nr:3'(2'),5'-bisphosphate nucleotidase CysQ [Roseomonas pecuniae]MCR0983701.1 3'(2'),5'-bisphosphate nucleotidase CysQ [Roseomonas pecuniae]
MPSAVTLDLAELAAAVRPIAERAGQAAMCFYGDAAATLKTDGSPVTAADGAAEDVILPALRALTPDIPVVSEEEASKGLSPEVTGPRFWLVDPLDGTREFISANGEFTVNIALVEDGVPVLGVVVVPARGETYLGAGPGTALLADAGGERPIAARPVPEDGLTVVGSRSHGDAAAMEAFLNGRKVAAFRPAGSSLKLCLIARGEADLYPRLGTTMEWDIAAGDAVLRAAGGRVETLDGGPFAYGKPGYRNPHFVASGR